MATILKADGIISNPKLGKIIALQLLTSESCIRSADTDLSGATTDIYNGGSAYSWNGTTDLFVLSELGLTNTLRSASGTVYLGMPLTKDVAVSFEAGPQGSEIIMDVRRVSTGDNYCYRLAIRPNAFSLLRRTSAGSTISNLPPLAEGDKVYATFKGSVGTVYINGVEAYTFDDSGSDYAALQRPGVIAMSRGSSNFSNHTYIKNLQVFALS